MCHRTAAMSVEQESLRGLSIAGRAARLLVVAFDASRQVGMHDPAHVGLVDSHAESDRGHHHRDFVPDKGLLSLASLLVLEPRVVCHRGEPPRGQGGGGALHRLACSSIHDAGLAGVPADEVQHLLIRISHLRGHPVEDLRPVEAGPNDERAAQAEKPYDVVLDRPGRRGREGSHGHAGELLAQQPERPVVRAELVTPFRDAVRLVHRDKRDSEPGESGAEAGKRQPLGRSVQESDTARGELPPGGAGFLLTQ